MIRIFVLAAIAAFALSAQSNSPIIVGQDGTYLGRLSSNRYEADSVSNPYGVYGSKYSADSINNPYGVYGSKYSPYSPNNPYTTQAPRIIAPRSSGTWNSWNSSPSLTLPSLPSLPELPSLDW